MTEQHELELSAPPKLIVPMKEKALPADSAAAGASGLLTPKQVSSMLGISVKALEKWRSQGNGPTVMRLTSKTLRYHLTDVEAYIASSRGA